MFIRCTRCGVSIPLNEETVNIIDCDHDCNFKDTVHVTTPFPLYGKVVKLWSIGHGKDL